MKKLALLAFALSIVFSIAGCSGTGLLGSLTGQSPFAGTYTGNFQASASSANFSGTITFMAIDTDGNVNGTVNGDQDGAGTITGTIDDQGFFSGQMAFHSGNTVDPTSGNLGFSSIGQLKGDLNVSIGSQQSNSVSFTLNQTSKRKIAPHHSK